VVAKKVGVAYVTISAGSEQRTCKIMVIDADYAVEILGSDVYVVVGTAKKLQAQLTHNGSIYNANVTWSTTGGNIEADGLIAWFTAEAKGEYTITVTSDVGKTATCVITVIEDLADIG
jgi:uncharacterized protein YjdB